MLQEEDGFVEVFRSECVEGLVDDDLCNRAVWLAMNKVHRKLLPGQTVFRTFRYGEGVYRMALSRRDNGKLAAVVGLLVESVEWSWKG